MFSSVFTKTLYEKRWSLLFWSLGVVLMSVLMMAFYDSFSQGGFDEALQNLPDQFKALVGDVASLKTIPGYVSQQVFALRIPLLTLIMAIVMFSGLIAGDEERGTLQSLLAQPVSRTSVYVQKYLAGAVLAFGVCLSAFVGVTIGLLIIGESMSLIKLFQSVVGVWLLTMTFGSLAYVIGAITGKKSLAGGLAGVAAFFSYLLTSFAPSVSGLGFYERVLSPFHYYNNPSIAQFGLDGSNVMLFVVLGVGMVFIGFWYFNKRDIQL